MEELLKKSTDKLKQNKNLIIIAVAFIGVWRNKTKVP